MTILVYNESSHDLIFAPENLHQAKVNFNNFVEFLSSIKKEKIISGIHYFDILSREIFAGYTISDWSNDQSIDKETRRKFQILIDKFLIPITTDEYLNEAHVKYNDINIISMGCAWAIASENPFVISAITSSVWEREKLKVQYLRLDEESEIVEEEHIIHNISKESDVISLRKNEIDEIFNHITSARDFWEKKSILFPNIEFCESVYEDINHTTKVHIFSIIERLKKMNDYFSQEHAKYNPDELGMNARTESQSVKNDSEMKKQRLFKLPSGDKKYFYDHIGFTGDYEGRIYFYPEVKNKKCYVGYIGKHLETKKYKHA